MPRKPSPRPKALPRLTGTPLPRDWRANSTWRIAAMLAKVPDTEYSTVVDAFETHHRTEHTLSEDWPARWREWCRGELMRRTAPVTLFTGGLFD